MVPTRDRRAEGRPFVKAFQTDPSWYEDHWYRDRPQTVVRHLRRALAALAVVTGKISSLRRLLQDAPSSEADALHSRPIVVSAGQLLLGERPARPSQRSTAGELEPSYAAFAAHPHRVAADDTLVGAQPTGRTVTRRGTRPRALAGAP
jgi:hypothetical protein